MGMFRSRVPVALFALVVGAVLLPIGSAHGQDAAAGIAESIEGISPEYDVRILRDTWGVPHIFGKTDADAAFGLAYAHCEDDFPTIQEVMLQARALGASVSGTDAAPVDFLVHALGTWDTVNAGYDRDLDPATRALCEAYAEGINAYARRHPDEIVSEKIFPATGKDIVAGFVFRGPFFYGLDNAVMELFGPERRRSVSEKAAQTLEDWDWTVLARAADFLTSGLPTGSNTFSVAPKRTADGSTFLSVNSHQPWEGPVAWYEAHVHSEEGWNAVGGTFPGAPLILHGHNEHLGWAHTVNSPDLVDIYVLEMNPDNPNQYRFDGEWLDLEVSSATLHVRVTPNSPMTMPVKREVLRSVHGPVLRQDHGVYAIRYAGMGDVRQVEQWYRMNKARTVDEWLDAMRMRAIPSLNCGYADKEGNILYLYNALLPIRAEGYDWRQYLPGDTSDTLWTEFLPFEKLPMVINPPSGFVQNCNSTPYKTTDGPGNPPEEDYSKTLGIETNMTNRALRALELFGPETSITWEQFNAFKYDMRYSAESFMGTVIEAIKNLPPQDDPAVAEAVKHLATYDLGTEPENRGTALAVMTALPLNSSQANVRNTERLVGTLKAAAERLKKTHGRLDVPWEDLNRLHRGEVDLGLGGGPDILHAVYGRLDEERGIYVGRAGDCYVLQVRWDADGNVYSESIHQYGSATLRPDSPHYADQAPLFVRRELKPVWFTEEAIRANLAREYRPGQEPGS